MCLSNGKYKDAIRETQSVLFINKHFARERGSPKGRFLQYFNRLLDRRLEVTIIYPRNIKDPLARQNGLRLIWEINKINVAGETYVFNCTLTKKYPQGSQN